MRLAMYREWSTFWTEAWWNYWTTYAKSRLSTASDHEKWLCARLLIPLSLVEPPPPPTSFPSVIFFGVFCAAMQSSRKGVV